MPGSIRIPIRWDRLTEWLIASVAVVLAVAVARPYAGGWNDGSRLATTETLVDRHTWRIDESTFVQVPDPGKTNTPLPYDPSEPGLSEHGTLDKLFIAGHYYSDKSPVPALLLAGCYRVWQTATGWTAHTHPDRFCAAMTWFSSGMAYVVSVLCIYQLGRRLEMPLSLRLDLTSSFALATVALPYTHHVNNHILLLAVTSTLTLTTAKLRDRMRQGQASWRQFFAMGSLAGLGYTIDLGAGPVILLCTSLYVLSNCLFNSPRSQKTSLRSPCHLFTLSPCLVFALAVLPWLGLHHALNYSIGGSWKPANAMPEYFRWPGSPFHLRNLTGSWVHSGAGSFLLYAASMLAGKRGFLGHNLPLFLALPAAVVLLRRHPEIRRELLWAVGCFGGIWLLYAATSNNSSGQCLSIRWFVPLLAPAYYVLALFLQRYPPYRVDFLVLSAWGVLLVLLMREGPWIRHMVPFFWPIQAAALLSWAFCRYLRRPSAPPSPLPFSCSRYQTSVY